MTTQSPSPARSVGFGIERLGHVSLSHPLLVLVLTALLYVGFTLCTLNLEFESDSRKIFKSERPAYAELLRIVKLYPGLPNQILLLIEGKKPLTSPEWERLRNLHLDLTLGDGITDVVSPFTARLGPKSANAIGKPLFPDTLDDNTDLEQLREQLRQHPLIAGKLVSKDDTAILMVLTFEAGQLVYEKAEETFASIRDTIDDALEGSSLSYGMTGRPMIRTQVITSLKRDQIKFIAAGFLVGWLCSFLFFREFKYVVIINIPGMFVVTALLGGMWLVDQKVNILTSMVTPLITVITLANTMHLTFAIRQALRDGLQLEPAIRLAISETGPGCVLSTLTTAVALVALAMAPYPFIYTFGMTAVYGTLLALFGTIVVLPPVALFILRRWPPKSNDTHTTYWLADSIDSLCRRTADLVARKSVFLAILGVGLVVALGAIYLQNEPHYTTRENLPAGSPASETIFRIDETVAGASRVRLILQWPDEATFPSSQALAAIADADKILSDLPWIRATWSLHDVARWAGSGGLDEDGVLKVINNNAEQLLGIAFTTTPKTALVSGYFRDTNISILLPQLQSLEARLDEFRRKWPDIQVTLSGVNTLVGTTAYDMIATLNISLITAIAVIIALIGFALRSPRFGLVSIVPNLLPLAAGGAYLYFTDKGLQFTSVVALTIGFGIAADSTIHYLNRYRIFRSVGQDPADAVSSATLAVGPVIVATTIILVAGLAATLLSNLPMVQLYGTVSVLVLSVALVGDLLFLPAILSVVDRFTAKDDPSSGHSD